MYIDTKTSFQANVSIPIGKLQSIILWCEKNCEAAWAFDSSDHDAEIPDYNFFFNSEKDYVAFLLWKK